LLKLISLVFKRVALLVSHVSVRSHLPLTLEFFTQHQQSIVTPREEHGVYLEIVLMVFQVKHGLALIKLVQIIVDSGAGGVQVVVGDCL